jgi:hypothetical protein
MSEARMSYHWQRNSVTVLSHLIHLFIDQFLCKLVNYICINIPMLIIVPSINVQFILGIPLEVTLE